MGGRCRPWLEPHEADALFILEFQVAGTSPSLLHMTNFLLHVAGVLLSAGGTRDEARAWYLRAVAARAPADPELEGAVAER